MLVIRRQWTELNEELHYSGREPQKQHFIKSHALYIASDGIDFIDCGCHPIFRLVSPEICVMDGRVSRDVCMLDERHYRVHVSRACVEAHQRMRV